MSADLLLVDVNLATMQDDAPGYGENRGCHLGWRDQLDR